MVSLDIVNFFNSEQIYKNGFVNGLSYLSSEQLFSGQVLSIWIGAPISSDKWVAVACRDPYLLWDIIYDAILWTLLSQDVAIICYQIMYSSLSPMRALRGLLGRTETRYSPTRARCDRCSIETSQKTKAIWFYPRRLGTSIMVAKNIFRSVKSWNISVSI